MFHRLEGYSKPEEVGINFSININIVLCSKAVQSTTRGNKDVRISTVKEAAKHLAAGQTVLHIRRVLAKRRMKKQNRNKSA